MQSLKNYLSRWPALRLARLALAAFLFYDGFKSGAAFMFLLGVFFAYQALANVGCSAGKNCEVNN